MHLPLTPSSSNENMQQQQDLSPPSSAPVPSSTKFLHEYTTRINQVQLRQSDGITILPLCILGKSVPPQLYGARLERTVAPRHAFLVYKGLPCGRQLLEDNSTLMKEFLNARSSKQFSDLCNRWAEKYSGTACNIWEPVSYEHVDAFATYFQRGLWPQRAMKWITVQNI